MEGNPHRYTIEESKKTENRTDIYSITWNIPIFKKLMRFKTNMNHITSGNTVVEVPDSKFQLKLRVFGTNNNLVEIYYATPATVFLRLTFNTGVQFGNTTKDISKDYHTVQSNQWQFCTALNPFTIGGCEDSTLRFNFIFSVSLDARVGCLNTLKHQLCDDFGNLLSEGSYSDVIIKSAEGEEFRVHKNVLAIRSNVLKAHFEHNTIESTTNVVKTTWETEVLRDVLAFIYTDKVSSVDNDPAKLLIAADYYQLQGLKSLCEEALSERLTVENAVETLHLAELHSANSLKVSTLEFIKDGRTKLITETEGWKNLTTYKVLKIMYEYTTAEEINGNDILTAALKNIN